MIQEVDAASPLSSCLIDFQIDPKNLNFSSAMFIDPLKTPYEGARLLARSINYVDVRDIALLIALSVAKDGIAGERIIGAAGVMYWQDLCRFFSLCSLNMANYSPYRRRSQLT